MPAIRPADPDGVLPETRRTANCCPPGCSAIISKYFAILSLLNQPIDERIFYPRVYLAASHEVFGITLIITWILTLSAYPEQVYDHPARVQGIIESFNPCFGWDYPPASYLAIVLCSTNVYLTWRFAWLEIVRTHLATPGRLSRVQLFAKYSAMLLALASNCWLLLWVVGPEDDDWVGHTALFVLYAAGSYLACLGNYLEVRGGRRRHVVLRRHTAFIVVYGVATVFLPAVYFIDLIWHEPGAGPVLPAAATQTADVVWMVCVWLTQWLMPPDLPLRMTMELVADEAEARRELDAITQGGDGGGALGK